MKLPILVREALEFLAFIGVAAIAMLICAVAFLVWLKVLGWFVHAIFPQTVM